MEPLPYSGVKTPPAGSTGYTNHRILYASQSHAVHLQGVIPLFDLEHLYFGYPLGSHQKLHTTSHFITQSAFTSYA